MSLFGDDFYSTRIRRSGRFRMPLRSLRVSHTLRVALASSVASSLLVAMFFLLFGAAGEAEKRANVPALANGAYLETEERIIAAAAKVRPVVVSIINYAEQVRRRTGNESRLEKSSLGSGIIFDKKGGKALIVTNAHVVQNAAELKVVLVDGRELEARIVGKDTITDLAVLEVDGEGINTVAEFGDSRKLRDGEMVIAVGNPLGFGYSLSQGIVSYSNRVIPISLNQDGIYDWEQEVIQTDAAINQGNSGGALVNLDGEVIGINSMKVAHMGVEGIGFAIPVHAALPVMESLVQYGKVKRPYMGVASINLSVYLEDAEGERETRVEGGEGKAGEDLPVIPEGVTEGVVVLETYGPAKKAGLKFNDIIVQLDDTPIANTLELRKYLYHHKKIGDRLRVTFYRDGERHTVELVLAEKDEMEGENE